MTTCYNILYMLWFNFIFQVDLKNITSLILFPLVSDYDNEYETNEK